MTFLVKTRAAGRLGAAALLAVAVAAPVAAEVKTPLTVVLGYVPNVENFGAIYAKANGFFDEEGLDVTLVPGGLAVDGLQMLDSGQSQITITIADNVIKAVDQGADLKVFAAQFQTTPVAMTCREESGVKAPTDLKGKRLAIKQGAQRTAETFLAKASMSLEDVEVTPIPQGDISTIIAGRVDCMLTTFAFNEPRLIDGAGVAVNVLRLGDFGLNSQPGVFTVTEDFWNSPGNKEVLVRYLTAEARGWDAFFKDPSGGAKFIVDGGFNDGLDLDQQTYQAVHQVDYMTSPLTAEKGVLWLDSDTWVQNTRNLFEAGVTTTEVDPARFITTEILEATPLPKY